MHADVALLSSLYRCLTERVFNGNTNSKPEDNRDVNFSNALAIKFTTLTVVLVFYFLLPGYYVQSCFVDFMVRNPIIQHRLMCSTPCSACHVHGSPTCIAFADTRTFW